MKTARGGLFAHPGIAATCENFVRAWSDRIDIPPNKPTWPDDFMTNEPDVQLSVGVAPRPRCIAPIRYAFRLLSHRFSEPSEADILSEPRDGNRLTEVTVHRNETKSGSFNDTFKLEFSSKE